MEFFSEFQEVFTFLLKYCQNLHENFIFIWRNRLRKNENWTTPIWINMITKQQSFVLPSRELGEAEVRLLWHQRVTPSSRRFLGPWQQDGGNWCCYWGPSRRISCGRQDEPRTSWSGASSRNHQPSKCPSASTCWSNLPLDRGKTGFISVDLMVICHHFIALQSWFCITI